MALTSMSFTSAALQLQQRPILGQDVPIAISRIGSVSDAATRELLKSVGLKPIDDVALRQIGGAPERISAFSQGAVAGFINPPGSIHLVRQSRPAQSPDQHGRSGEAAGISMGLCGNHQELLAKRRDTVKRLVMALTEATHYFKSDKEGTQKIIAKYHASANKGYLKMLIVQQ